MGRFWIGLAILAVALEVAGARADETLASGTSVDTEKSNLLDQVNFVYWMNYNGPTLGNISSLQNNPNGTSANGNIGNAQSIDTFLMAGYKLSSDVDLGPVVEFHYRPVLGQDIAMNDSGVRLNDAHVIKTENFNLAVDLRLFAPVASNARQGDMLTGVESVHILTYNVPHTKLTIGYYGYVRGRMYSNVVPDVGQQSFTIYGAPNLAYALSPKVQFTIWNDLIGLGHLPGVSGTMLSMTNAPIDVEPGINWDISPYLSLNPYINVYTASPTLSATYVGMIMTGKLL